METSEEPGMMYGGMHQYGGGLMQFDPGGYVPRFDNLTAEKYHKLTGMYHTDIKKILEAYVMETEVRKMSQTDSLMIYTGGYWGVPNTEVNGMKIPSICWKVVYSLSKKKVVLCTLFYNNDTPVKVDGNLENLELMLGYSLGVYPETKKKKK